MKNLLYVLGLLLALSWQSCVTGGQERPKQERESTGQPDETAVLSESYFTGDGGKGLRLVILEPAGKGITPGEHWMLSLVQGSITGDFNKYSAMTIIDRQNLEKILAEQAESLSGNYSDNDFISIGNLTNARYVLTGSISKTVSSYMLELSVSDIETGERKASYPPKSVSPAALENLSAVKEASLEILKQLGVNLTSTAIADLKKPMAVVQIQAETALAKGIIAQKQGTEVAALSYYYQAALLSPSLLEAVSRSSVITADITSGNIRTDARNDIQWRRDWIARLSETERYFDDFFKTASLPYSLFYSTDIAQGVINYQNETMTLSIETILHGSQLWIDSVGSALQTVYMGLEATQRKEAWGLERWPQQGVTDLKPFERKNKNFSVVIELVNSRGQVIGSQTQQVQGAWEFRINRGLEILVSADDRKTVNFTSVKVDDITDSLIIRVASVNGEDAQTAAQKGVLQVQALTEHEWKFSNAFVVKNGIITGPRDRSRRIEGELIIQTVWFGEPVNSIGDRAFESNRLTMVTIPQGIISIGVNAFADNQLTAVIIPNSVISIGSGAFKNNKLTDIVIPVSVTSIEAQVFANNELSDFTWHDGITSIGEDAFNGNKITGIVIPNRVTTIGGDAFRNNPLKSVLIGARVTSIGDGAFYVNGLTRISIRANVRLASNSFPNYFSSEYDAHRRRAGVYIYREYSRGGLMWGLTGERYPF